MRPSVSFAMIPILMMPCVAASAEPDKSVWALTNVIGNMRDLIGKSLLDVTVDLNNNSKFVLESITPEGTRFFWGGSSKEPGENADSLRQSKAFSILITPCSGVHDLRAKVSSVAMWQTLDDRNMQINVQPTIGLGLQQLLEVMNAPTTGVVTPSAMRSPRTNDLKGLVFEYVRGDTTETVSLVNEGSPLRISWSITNTAVCPH
jgi:hypothetical protein